MAALLDLLLTRSLARAEAADPDLAAAQRNLGMKHGLERDGKPTPYAATASGRSRRWIVFVPERVVSWNNERLGDGQP